MAFDQWSRHDHAFINSLGLRHQECGPNQYGADRQDDDRSQPQAVPLSVLMYADNMDDGSDDQQDEERQMENMP